METNTTIGAGHATARCAYCGARALLPLGHRRDRPHRWRFWTTATTQILYCSACEAVCEWAAGREHDAGNAVTPDGAWLTPRPQPRAAAYASAWHAG